MSGLFKFQQEDEECCNECELLSDFLEMILNSDSEDEVAEILHGLYQGAKTEGYKEALADGMRANAMLLAELSGYEDGNCDEEECEF